MAKTRYIVSDLHVGAGDYLDEFNQDQAFKDFLESIAKRKGSELIINGDFIDFVAVTLEKDTVRPFSRLGCTEGESLRKLERVLEAHPSFFRALRAFIEKGHRLVLIPGNHDIDLFWPEVRDRLVEELGAPDSDHFHFESSGVYRVDDLYVEHGNQYYADSVFEKFTNPFLRDPKTGELRLERCWGNCFMEYFVNGMMSERNPFINNVRPIPNMVWMGIQDESWWFKIITGYKLFRFISRVGFPPFKESRELLRRKREGRLDGEEYSKRRFMGMISRSSQMELPEGSDAVHVETELPEEAEPYEPDQDDLHLDSLATREDALSVAARELLTSDSDIDVVVLGHDHRYYSNELRPVLEGKRGEYYINTGTWIPMLFLTRTKRKLRWRDLQNQELYQQILTYCVVKKGLGGTAASLKRFKKHEDEG